MTKNQYMVPTNRYNAVALLSRGLVVPREGFAKYYKDLMQLAPGYVLLIAGPIGGDTIAYLSEDGQSSFPVLIETAFISTSRGVVASEIDSGAIVAVPGVLPLVTARVHFATDYDRSEFEAGEYSNFDPAGLELLVSPEMFDPGLDQLQSIEVFTSSLPDPGSPLLGSIGVVDAFAGAITMGMQSATTVDDAQRIAEGPAVLTLGTNEISHRSNLIEFIQDFAGHSPDDQVLVEAVTAAILDESELSREAPRSFVGLVRERLDSASKGSEQILRSLETVSDILMGGRSLHRFRQRGLESAKALLLYLLRPDPEGALSWLSEDTGARQSTLVLAASFAGLGRGARGLAEGVRGDRELRNLLSEAQADAINAERGSTIERSLSEPPTIKALVKSAMPGYVSIVYKRGRSKVFGTTLPEPTIRGSMMRADLSDPGHQARAVDIARQLEWTDTIVTSVRFGSATLDVDSGRNRLRILGEYSVEREIDASRFYERLKLVAEADLAAAVDAVDESQVESSAADRAGDHHNSSPDLSRRGADLE